MDKKNSDEQSIHHCDENPSVAWRVYILRCADGTLYTGSTNNLTARLLKHNAGRGAKYTRGRLPVQCIYFETEKDRSAALKREASLKRLTRKEKDFLIMTVAHLPKAKQ